MTPDYIEVIPLTTEVTLKLSEYKGIITAINIRKGRIIYEVAHYEDGHFKELWLEDYQFTINDGSVKKTKVGFIR